MKKLLERRDGLHAARRWPHVWLITCFRAAPHMLGRKACTSCVVHAFVSWRRDARATGIFWLNMKTLLERRDVLHGGTTMASRVAHNVLSGCASRAWEERMYILRRACVCVLEMGLLLCRLTHCHHKYHYFEQKNSHYMAKILERRDGQKAQAEKTLT